VFYLIFKLVWVLALVCVWMAVAVVVLPLAAILAVAGSRAGAGDCMRALDWSRMF